MLLEKAVDTNPMPARPVQKGAEELVEQGGHRQAIGALAQGAEEAIQKGGRGRWSAETS